jgi:hypothetical protein
MKSRSMILSLWGGPTSHSWAPAGHRPQPVLGTGDGPGEGGRRSGGDNGGGSEINASAVDAAATTAAAVTPGAAAAAPSGRDGPGVIVVLMRCRKVLHSPYKVTIKQLVCTLSIPHLPTAGPGGRAVLWHLHLRVYGLNNMLALTRAGRGEGGAGRGEGRW